MDKLPFISIVSLNWNSYSELSRLLKSVFDSNYPNSMFEVIVVDNGSADGSVEKIRKNFPKTKVIALNKNYGIWAKNYGFKEAKGEYTVYFDSDAILPTKDTLTRIIKRVLENPEIGILGVKVINKISGKPELSPMNLNFFTGIISMGNPDLETTKATWIPFVCIVFPKKTFKKVGLIYKTFVYGDDPNFSLRVREKGLKVLYWPGAFIYHFRPKTRADVSFDIKYHHYYKAIFREVFRFGNIIHKISTTIFQLLIIPFFGVFWGRKMLLKARWWGFCWNLKRIPFESKILIFSVTTGILLRLLALKIHDFWFDEAFTYHISRLSPKELISATLSDNNPPIYYLIIHFLLKISRNEIFLRIPSLLASLAVIFIFIRYLPSFLNRKVVYLASSFFALSPLAVYLSSEARPHSFAIVLVAILTVSFLNVLKNPKTKNVITFIIFSLVGIFSHFYALSLLPAFTVVVMVRKTKLTLKKWFLILTLVLIPFLPWATISATLKHTPCSCPNTLLSLPSTLVSPAIAGVDEVTLRSYTKLPSPILIVFLISSLVTLIMFLRGLTKNRLLSIIYLIPLLTISALGLFFPFFSPKAFAIFIPIYFLGVGAGINSLIRQRRLLVFLTLLYIATSGVITLNPFFAGTKLKPILEVVRRDTNAPIVHTSLLTLYSTRYYTGDVQKNLLITKNPLSRETLKFIGGEKEEIASDSKELWLVDTKKWADEKERENAIQRLYTIFSVQKYYQIDNINVSYLKRK